MKKLLIIILSCLAGMVEGLVYFFATTFFHYTLNYSIDLSTLAVAGFVFFCLLNFVLYRLIKKRHRPFGLGFLITASVVDLIFLIIMSSVRNYA
jgi:uncharacterized membrane protein (UPF0136 family)